MKNLFKKKHVNSLNRHYCSRLTTLLPTPHINGLKIFRITLLGIPITQIWTSLSGTRHCETAPCPKKKHRQKPKVLSVTPNLWRATCFPKQRCLSLVLFDHRRQSTHVLNKETLVTPVSYGFNKNVPASCSKIPHLGQSSNLLVKSSLSSAFSWLDIYHGIIRSSTSSEQLPADPSVGCARWPTASSPYPPPLPLMPKQKRGLGQHGHWVKKMMINW